MSKKTMSAESKSILKEVLGMFLYVIAVFVAVWFVITFVGQRTEVSGDSMYDTLEDGDNLWIDKLSYRFKDPERYDIVVFPFHDSEVFYIKRIIGVPGETIRIDEEGNIYVDGKVLEESYGYETISPSMIGRAREEVILGDDEYFVMGDNREVSLDSRYQEVGFVRKEQILGKASLRIWPLTKFGKVK